MADVGQYRYVGDSRKVPIQLVYSSSHNRYAQKMNGLGQECTHQVLSEASSEVSQICADYSPNLDNWEKWIGV